MRGLMNHHVLIRYCICGLPRSPELLAAVLGLVITVFITSAAIVHLAIQQTLYSAQLFPRPSQLAYD
jgi:hypothetical protein